jgi:putative PIN family toxin of toxin-antitoxin system
MKIALDTNVLMAAMISPHGASYAVLAALIDGEITIVATPALWAEYEEQLSSVRFRELTPLGREEVNDILDYLAAVTSPVANDFVWRGILPDEDEAMIVETAFNGDADFLVTFNERDFDVIKGHVPFQIAKPAAFLEMWRREGDR